MSDNQPDGNLMDRLARVDSKLEKLLDGPTLQKENGRSKTPNSPDAEFSEDPDLLKDSGSSGPPADPQPHRAAVSPGEADGILPEVGNLNRDVQVMERLDRLERQNRKIVTLGSLFMTLMILMLGASTFLVIQANRVNKGAILTASPQADPPAPPAGEAVAKGHKPQTPAPVAGVQGPLAAGPITPAGDPKPVAAPAAAKPAPATAPVKYVGFTASNKYHYPNCKWAAGINHYPHRTFSSVQEARAKGYIPCPTCNPPSHD
jgi:hypothetical protein